MNLFDLGPPLLGGAAIGLASALLLVVCGRIAGVSGILFGLLRPVPGEIRWQAAFVAGLVVGGAALAVLMPGAFPEDGLGGPGLLAAAGVLVGIGSKLGSGCTSGHGVCGIGRLSPRSLVATITFITTGALTVIATRVFS